MLPLARTNYEKALKIKSSLEIALEAGQMYVSRGEYNSAESWYNHTLVTSYPKEPAVYCFGIQVEKAMENYKKAFRIYDTFQQRKLVSEDVEKEISSIYYSYWTSGSYTDAMPISNTASLAAVYDGDYWGYINMNGSAQTGWIYTDAGLFGDVAAVTARDGTCYLVDQNGDETSAAWYFEKKDPSIGKIVKMVGPDSGILLATNGEQWSYYNVDSHEKLFGPYAGATTFSGDIAAVTKDGSKWALIDMTGKELTGYDFDEVVCDAKGYICRGETLFVKKDGAYRLVDKSGRDVGGDTYEAACGFLGNEPAAVQKNGKWTFVDMTGKDVGLGSFDEARSFSSGLAAVRKGSYWGYIDLTGSEGIPCQYVRADDFGNMGAAFVRDDRAVRLLRLYRLNHS